MRAELTSADLHRIQSHLESLTDPLSTPNLTLQDARDLLALALRAHSLQNALQIIVSLSSTAPINTLPRIHAIARQSLGAASPASRQVTQLLDGIPFALSRARSGKKDARTGRTQPLSRLSATAGLKVHSSGADEINLLTDLKL